jgi:release factor glutamine methyltransferase
VASLAELVFDAVTRLTRAGLSADDARGDASLLARMVLQWDAATWLIRQREAAPTDFPAAFDAAITRRASREPVAYITGEREFYGRVFHVTHDVLIPRPETEGIIDAALECLRTKHASTKHPAPARSTPHEARSSEHAAQVLDLGTGGGCLAITLALEVPAARVAATDISAAALAVARANAARLGAQDRVTFIQGSWLAGQSGPFDVIVSNPPYVAESARTTLAPEVADYEPHEALFGGADGLGAYRALAPMAARVLRPGGVLICEIGGDQADAVSGIMTAAGLRVDDVRPDLQGIARVVIARNPAAL